MTKVQSTSRVRKHSYIATIPYLCSEVQKVLLHGLHIYYLSFDKYWVGNKVISFFFMIFKASSLIQITNINQLYIDHFVR